MHEHGFQDLKECDSGTSGSIALDMSEKQYAELYRYLYDEMTNADKRKLKKLELKDDGKEEKSAQANDDVNANEKISSEGIGSDVQIIDDNAEVKSSTKTKKSKARKLKKKA